MTTKEPWPPYQGDRCGSKQIYENYVAICTAIANNGGDPGVIKDKRLERVLKGNTDLPDPRTSEGRNELAKKRQRAREAVEARPRRRW